MPRLAGQIKPANAGRKPAILLHENAVRRRAGGRWGGQGIAEGQVVEGADQGDLVGRGFAVVAEDGGDEGGGGHFIGGRKYDSIP